MYSLEDGSTFADLSIERKVEYYISDLDGFDVMVTEQRFVMTSDDINKEVFFYCTPILEYTEDSTITWLEGSIDHVTLYTFGNVEYSLTLPQLDLTADECNNIYGQMVFRGTSAAAESSGQGAFNDFKKDSNSVKLDSTEKTTTDC